MSGEPTNAMILNYLHAPNVSYKFRICFNVVLHKVEQEGKLKSNNMHLDYGLFSIEDDHVNTLKKISNFPHLDIDYNQRYFTKIRESLYHKGTPQNRLIHIMGYPYYSPAVLDLSDED